VGSESLIRPEELNRTRKICRLGADILCGRPPGFWRFHLEKVAHRLLLPWGTFTPIL